MLTKKKVSKNEIETDFPHLETIFCTYRQILTGLRLNDVPFADLLEDLEESKSQVSFNIITVYPAFSSHEKKNSFSKKRIDFNKACAQIAAVL